MRYSTQIYTILFFCLFILRAESNSEKDIITEDRLSKIKSILNNNVNLAPDITLNDYNDSLHVLSKLKGQVVLLNFWATWCGPCRMEIPDFNILYEKYHQYGFEILGISLSDSKKQLLDFSKVYGVKYQLLYGSYKDIDEITKSFGGVPAVPWSFLIGIEGEIIKTYPGAILKDYDPILYQDLTYTIENQLKISNQDLE